LYNTVMADWVEKAGRRARREMQDWPEWKLRMSYTLFRPDDWQGSEEDYKRWRDEIFAEVGMWELYADGACQPNPGVGGWAYLLKNPDEADSESIGSGSVKQSTNNQMELTGILEGLQYFNAEIGGDYLKVVMDSSYCIDGMRSWTHAWRKNNWCKKDGKPVLNVELWKSVVAELDKIATVEFELVKGHSGHPENTICDKIAVQEIKKRNGKG